MLRLKTILLLMMLVACFKMQAATPLQPGKLSCEYAVNPLGIDHSKPRLSWTLSSKERNQNQSAYEIIVSNDQTTILSGIGDAWQTGKVNSSQNLHIEYGGKPLKPFTRYFWRIKLYDALGEASSWSAPASFETAMLQPSDWKAQWIGDDRKQFTKPEDFYKDDPAPLIRHSFNVSKKIKAARLYVSGLGYYEAYFNGQKVGDHVLDPGWTTYKKQAFFVTHDITKMLQQGGNTIGFMLGNGWYNPLPLQLFGRFNLRDVQQTGRPCVKAQILVFYSEGHGRKSI